jgi:hypothetical protein
MLFGGKKWQSLKRIPQWPIKVKYEIKTSTVYPSRDEKRQLTGGYQKTGDFGIWPIIDNEKLFGCARCFHGQSP